MMLLLLTFVSLLAFSALLWDTYTMEHQQTLYILRGIPGSGKSTLAREMASQLRINYYEADMYFLDDEGYYEFDFNRLHYAHNWCRHMVKHEINEGHSVIVSNTFTRWKEMREYVDDAIFHNMKIKIIHCTGSFKNVHNVPEEKVKEMTERFVMNEELPQTLGIEYSVYNPVAEVADLNG